MSRSIDLTHGQIQVKFGIVADQCAHVIRASADTGAAANAQLGIDGDDAAFVLGAGSGGADGHAAGLGAVLAGDWEEAQCAVGKLPTGAVVDGISFRHRHARMAVVLVAFGVHHVKGEALGQVVGNLAGSCTGLATEAAVQVDGHSVSSHVCPPYAFSIATATSLWMALGQPWLYC